MEKQKSKKSTRRSLYMSALSLLLCVVMLLGTTFAWFTRVISSEGNYIQTGEILLSGEWSDATDIDITWFGVCGLEVPLFTGDLPADGKWVITPNSIGASIPDGSFKLLPADTNNGWYPINQGAIIMEDVFEPNKSGAKYIKLSGAGSTLAYDLLFALNFNNVDPVTGEIIDDLDIAKLSEVLKVMVRPVADVYVPLAAPTQDQWYDWPTLDVMIAAAANGGLSFDSRQSPFGFVNGVPCGEEFAFRIDYMMCPWAGNEYQNKRIEASINAMAIQHNTYGYDFDFYGNGAWQGVDQFDNRNMLFTIGSLDDLEAALIALGNNPGMTWHFTNDITITEDWALAHDWFWYDSLGVESGGYVDFTDYDTVFGLAPGTIGSMKVLNIFKAVNIDLGGYTFDLSILENTGMFTGGGAGPEGLFFSPAATALPSAMEISNGTLLVKKIQYALFDGDYEPVSSAINLTPSLNTNAEVEIFDGGFFNPYSADDVKFHLNNVAISTAAKAAAEFLLAYGATFAVNDANLGFMPTDVSDFENISVEWLANQLGINIAGIKNITIAPFGAAGSVDGTLDTTITAYYNIDFDGIAIMTGFNFNYTP